MTRYALHVTVAFVLVFAASAVADDPYAGYIKMQRADTSYSAHSWNQAGNWDSGGAAPEPGSNYYVQPGMELWRWHRYVSRAHGYEWHATDIALTDFPDS